MWTSVLPATVVTAVGAGVVAGEAVEGIARVPESHSRVTMTMLIGQALAQNTAILGFVVAILLWTASKGGDVAVGDWATSLPRIAACLGAGIAMGAGAMGPALGIGQVCSRACASVARNQANASLIQQTMFVGAAVSESTAIYSLVVAFLLYTFVG